MDGPDFPISVMAASAVSLSLCASMFEISAPIRKLALALLVANAFILLCCVAVKIELFSQAPAFLMPMSLAVMSAAALFAIYIACSFPLARRR